ncbi:MAG: YnbE family lipoprotein [Sphingosinicella sp.]|nr:YnbE family lipoprotein [Sphingosinicella sp.]
MGKALPLAGMLLLPMLTGCVKVSAPDRPIEINLNINIKQEVVVRLTEDVRELRQKEPGVF